MRCTYLLALTMFLLTNLPVFAQSETQYHQPIWSPDNTHIAFVVDDIDGTDKLVVVDIYTQEMMSVLSVSEGYIILFEFSPDGNSVLYSLSTDEEDSAWSVDIDTLETTQLTEDGIGHAIYSVDGSSIAFLTAKSRASWEVWVMDSDGTNRVQITPDDDCYSPLQWISENELLLWSCSFGGDGIYLYDLENMEMQKVIDGTVFDVTLSPNQDVYAYVRPRGDSLLENDIWLMDDSIQTNITEEYDFSYIQDLSWSPDGTQLLFSYHCSDGSGIGILNLEDDTFVDLTWCVAEMYFGFPSWSADGEIIVFQGDTEGELDIWLYHVDEKGFLNLTETIENEG